MTTRFLLPLLLMLLVTVELSAQGETCAEAMPIDSLLTGPSNSTSSTDILNNYSSTSDDTDPTTGWECFIDISLDRTQWFSFVGDGESYIFMTTSCDGTVTDYVDLGDTQMSLYSGTCDSLTSVFCNEDFNTAAFQWQAVVGIDASEVGLEYRIMVDTYNGADGEYCLSVVRLPRCVDIAVGTPSIEEPIYCPGDTLIASLEGETLVPFVSGSFGDFLWIFSNDELTNLENPLQDPALEGAIESQNFFVPIDALEFDPGTYYMTPIVFGEVTDTEAPMVGDNGCILLGETLEFELLESSADEMLGEIDEINEENQTVSLTILGGSGDYSYEWSDGSTDEVLMFEESGTYTVTISDEDECTADIELEVTVVVSGLDDAIVEQIEVFPNPASGQVNLQWAGADVIFVNYSVSSIIGKTILSSQLDGNETILSVDVSNYPSGTYIVQLETADRNSFKVKVVVK